MPRPERLVGAAELFEPFGVLSGLGCGNRAQRHAHFHRAPEQETLGLLAVLRVGVRILGPGEQPRFDGLLVVLRLEGIVFAPVGAEFAREGGGQRELLEGGGFAPGGSEAAGGPAFGLCRGKARWVEALGHLADLAGVVAKPFDQGEGVLAQHAGKLPVPVSAKARDELVEILKRCEPQCFEGLGNPAHKRRGDRVGNEVIGLEHRFTGRRTAGCVLLK